jgi:RNA polymerase sigma factor (sigma-70 family)
MTEKELVEGCIREDRECQRLLWEKYSKKLMALCLRYCQNQEEAEDALMEAFVKIYNKLGDFRFQSSLETWMRRVAVNISINKIRSRKNIFKEISESEYEIGYSDFSFDRLNVDQINQLIEKYPTELLGIKSIQYFGNNFPLLFKFIDAKEDLSIQVHPNDALAKERHNSFGKTEMWYVMQADDNARLVVGFKDKTNKKEYQGHLENKTLTENNPKSAS